jgi:hypothetical protein
MSINVCPIATLHVPVEKAWRFLAEPANYALWWDAETQSISPEGGARPGQKIYAQTSGLGRRWGVNIIIEAVDESKHQIDLKTMLPFGITVYNHITCVALDNENCRVSFG